MSRGLSPKQEAFCQAYVETGNASEAYRRAYPRAKHWKPEAVNVAASRLLANARVSLRVQALKDELAKRKLWTREQSVKALIQVINNPERNSDIIAAVKELNAMHGFNAPDKLEISGSGGGPVILNIRHRGTDGK